MRSSEPKLPFRANVHVLEIHHPHGVDIRLNKTEKGAWKALAAFCREHWPISLGDPMEDDEGLIEEYFNHHEGCEWYDLNTQELGE